MSDWLLLGLWVYIRKWCHDSGSRKHNQEMRRRAAGGLEPSKARPCGQLFGLSEFGILIFIMTKSTFNPMLTGKCREGEMVNRMLGEPSDSKGPQQRSACYLRRPWRCLGTRRETGRRSWRRQNPHGETPIEDACLWLRGESWLLGHDYMWDAILSFLPYSSTILVKCYIFMSLPSPVRIMGVESAL